MQKRIDISKKKKERRILLKKMTESDNIAKNIWKVAKEVLHNQETQNESYKGEKTPDEFNNQFINTGNGLLDKEKRKVKPKAVPSKIKPQQASFRLYKTTTEEISKYIDELKNKTNQTLDKLTSKLIKICKEELAPIIMDLVNISFEQGQVPSLLKIARVVPVYKKGAREDCSNYRPISILPPISKILEMAMRARFRKSTNTTYAALDIIVKIQDSLDKNLISAGLFIDLAKAFDTVDHPSNGWKAILKT
ncbi:RNA-directed DNA polymerase from mobile element jockey [Frankliniella fusca]|uniref:RNA-directed DNA polymerase from mobile element jockey n=1 Tax=Frankliniella fusca TaxID=407009 RepID=A0AAE1LGT4_9NEOP|nr:RNA-directed DNA polymerase from mobile element jockey [Frankliniella fusca]